MLRLRRLAAPLFFPHSTAHVSIESATTNATTTTNEERAPIEIKWHPTNVTPVPSWPLPQPQPFVAHGTQVPVPTSSLTPLTPFDVMLAPQYVHISYLYSVGNTFHHTLALLLPLICVD
jgi:hypothetical protein